MKARFADLLHTNVVFKFVESAQVSRLQSGCAFTRDDVEQCPGDLRDGWTRELRTRYFRQLPKMRDFLGGEGMPAFLSRIEAETTAGLTEQQRQRFAPLLARKTTPIEIPAAARNRKFGRNRERPVDSEMRPLLTFGERRIDCQLSLRVLIIR